jgi:hypothetical protein
MKKWLIIIVMVIQFGVSCLICYTEGKIDARRDDLIVMKELAKRYDDLWKHIYCKDPASCR